MSRGPEKLLKSIKQFTDLQYKHFTRHYAPQLNDILDFPTKVVLSPFTLAFDIAGSAPRVFGVPELLSKLSYSAIFVVAALGTYDLAFELGRKLLCQSGEKAKAESIADAISENRVELVHLPSTVDLNLPLPSKDCPSCHGTGVMKCPECDGKLPIRISADDFGTSMESIKYLAEDGLSI